jgi:eukaryotic translation initiation factor 2C
MVAAVNLPPAEIDSRLAANELQQLTLSLSKVKLQGDGGELPIRPGFGSLGKSIKLRSNYFPVEKFPQYLFEYDVKVRFACKNMPSIKLNST